MRTKMKWMAWVAVVGLVAFASIREALAITIWPNQSGAPNGSFETTVATVSTNSLGSLGTGNVIYGWKVFAAAASAWGAIYDSATLPATLVASRVQGTFIDEGGEATAFDVWESSWPMPYRLVTDLSVEVGGAADTSVVTVAHDVVQ